MDAAVSAHLQWLTRSNWKAPRSGSLAVYNAHGGQGTDDESTSTDLEESSLVEDNDAQPSSPAQVSSPAQPDLATEPAPPASWLSGVCGECAADDDTDYTAMFVQPHHRVIMRRILEDEEQGPQQTDLDWLYSLFCLR